MLRLSLKSLLSIFINIKETEYCLNCHKPVDPNKECHMSYGTDGVDLAEYGLDAECFIFCDEFCEANFIANEYKDQHETNIGGHLWLN